MTKFLVTDLTAPGGRAAFIDAADEYEAATIYNQKWPAKEFFNKVSINFITHLAVVHVDKITRIAVDLSGELHPGLLPKYGHSIGVWED